MSSESAPTPHGRAPERGDEVGETEETPEPVGTLFLLTIYVIVLAGMWGTMYWILITR